MSLNNLTTRVKAIFRNVNKFYVIIKRPLSDLSFKNVIDKIKVIQNYQMFYVVETTILRY